MEMDSNAVLLGEDILDPYGGAFKVTKGLSTKFPQRVFTTPISEASIAGLAVGMALRGMRPIAEFMFGDFITLAADQIVNHAAKYIGMYSDQIKLSMVLRTPVGGGGADMDQHIANHWRRCSWVCLCFTYWPPLILSIQAKS